MSSQPRRAMALTNDGSNADYVHTIDTTYRYRSTLKNRAKTLALAHGALVAVAAVIGGGLLSSDTVSADFVAFFLFRTAFAALQTVLTRFVYLNKNHVAVFGLQVLLALVGVANVVVIVLELCGVIELVTLDVVVVPFEALVVQAIVTNASFGLSFCAFYISNEFRHSQNRQTRKLQSKRK